MPPIKKLMSMKAKLFGEKGTSVFYDQSTPEEEEINAEAVGRSVFYNGSEEEEETDRKSKFYDGSEDDCDDTGAIETKSIEVRFNLPSTVLWAETHPVISSGILENMTTYDIALQESKFEIITSELRYLNSLSILITNFYESKELCELSTKEEWLSLFGNILKVKNCSASILSDLMSLWDRDIMLSGIYPILRKHSVYILKVYVDYCKNQPFALLTLQMLMVSNDRFLQTLQNIERGHETLMSFLTLPMQRITRIPLLFDAILSRLDSTTVEFTLCRLAKSAFQQIAQECNAAVIQTNVNMTENGVSKDKKVSYSFKMKK